MLLFTQFVHSFQTAVSCDRLQEQNHPSIVLLGEAQPWNRNKQKGGGGVFIPARFLLHAYSLAFCCFLTFTENTSVFMINPNLFQPWKHVF